MKKRLALALATIMLFGTALTGCSNTADQPQGDPPASEESGSAETETPAGESESPTTPDGEKVINFRVSGALNSFTPNVTSDDNGYQIHQNLYNRLCKLDASKSTPIPDLAESWEYSDDVMTLTFYLKENAKWHDGEPVTSADVKYTFDTIKENDTFYFSTQMVIVDSIDTPDDYTVVFNLNTPDASLVSLLGWYGTFVLPKHVYEGTSWEDYPAGANSNPIGSGPFKFDSYRDSEYTILVKNADYHDAEPNLDKVIFSIISDPSTAYQALKNGEIDYMTGIPTANFAEAMANPDLEAYLNPYPSPVRLIFNVEDDVVSDVNVRRAIATAIDRDEISQKAYFGYNVPEYNYYPSFVAWATNNDDTAPAYNTEAAMQILEDAGYTKDADGYYVKVSLDYFPTLSGADDTALLLQAQLRAAGIDLELIISEYQAWVPKMEAGNFQIEMQGGFMGPDPSALKNRLVSGMRSNYGNYANPAFDELIVLGGASADQDERAKYYYDAQTILAEDIPYLPIVTVSTPEAYWNIFTNMPIDGTGQWGWGEFTWTDMK